MLFLAASLQDSLFQRALLSAITFLVMRPDLVVRMQVTVKKEAAALAVEEQLREKEAVEAENAAAQAKIAENEAMVSLILLPNYQHKSKPHLLCAHTCM